ncbi:MAG: DUF6282 family protein [Spirochaetaceae bacterium]|jgi:hypothetical protein|nr:DUF6282 family protein [Spirochaetaceae bacterium]
MAGEASVNDIGAMGVFDTHVHSFPSHFPRLFDDLELEQAVVKSGLGGVVLKFHAGPTAERAYIANKHAGREVFFGSITLNSFMGGINPIAVEGELLLGAKIVWFPTIHSANHIRFYGGSDYKNMKAKHSLPVLKHGIVITGEDGKLIPEVFEVLDLIAKYDVCVATGHMSIEESAALCRAALKRGIKKVVLTHPDFETQKVPLPLQVELAREGAMIEKTALNLRWKNISIGDLVKSIAAIGPEHCILSTDYGQVNSPPIPEGISCYISELIANGVKKDDIELMFKHNPKKILGLES